MSSTVAARYEDAPDEERHETNPPQHQGLLQSSRSPVVRRILPLSFRALRRLFVCLVGSFFMPSCIRKQ